MPSHLSANDWFMEQQFWLRSKGRHLAAVLHMPQVQSRSCVGCGRSLRVDSLFCYACGRRLDPPPAYPMVLMLHGFASHKGEDRQLFVRIARKLASNGIAALRFDFAHSGDSEGNFENTTVSGWVDDAQVAYEYIQALNWVDHDRIGVLGLSGGGGVAALLLPVAKFKCVVQWAPVADFVGLAVRVFHVTPQEVRSGRRPVDDGEGNAVKGRFLRELNRLHPLTNVRGFKGSVLILHGASDDIVSPSDSQSYLIAYGNPAGAGPRELHLIRSPGHTFPTPAGTNEVLDRTTYWFKKHL